MTQKYICISIISALAFVTDANAANPIFIGGSKEVIVMTPERNTGLDALYVAHDMSEISTIKIHVSGQALISKFSSLGGGYAQPVEYRMEGEYAVIDNPEGDMGYIIEERDKTSYFWIVNYRNHTMTLQGVKTTDTRNCDGTEIDIAGEASPIYYYTVDGRRCELSRDIEIDYSNLEWSDEADNYQQVSVTKTLPHISGTVTITPPLYCSSTFTITGDRFLDMWGIGQTVTSISVTPNGLSCHTSAEQTNLPDEDEDPDGSNVIKTEVNGLGGSAPVEVSFKAQTTDAVIHNEWQIASDQQFEYIDYRFNEQNLDYTFTDEGSYYIRYVGSNTDGSCETIGDAYTISVGSSELKIPNAFTPNDDGINDVWKISYRSLIDFRCTIFDRYGNQLYHFTDPSKGWNGKYNGKVVKPGVYFYVIEAKGSDGKRYKKGGDINIIKSKKYNNSGNGDTTEGTPAAD